MCCPGCREDHLSSARHQDSLVSDDRRWPIAGFASEAGSLSWVGRVDGWVGLAWYFPGLSWAASAAGLSLRARARGRLGAFVLTARSPRAVAACWLAAIAGWY